MDGINEIGHFDVFLLPATKLGQGYVFTGVCHSVNRGGLHTTHPPGADPPQSIPPGEQTPPPLPPGSRTPPRVDPPGTDPPPSGA